MSKGSSESLVGGVAAGGLTAFGLSAKYGSTILVLNMEALC